MDSWKALSPSPEENRIEVPDMNFRVVHRYRKVKLTKRAELHVRVAKGATDVVKTTANPISKSAYVATESERSLSSNP